VFECPACGGRRTVTGDDGQEQECEACGGRGEYEVGVPIEQYVDRETWKLLTYARLYEKGLPPVAGGALDQTAWFIEACTFVWNEQATWRSKLGIWHW